MSPEAQKLLDRIARKPIDLAEILMILESAEHKQALSELRFNRKYSDYRDKMISKYGIEKVTELEKEAVNHGT